MRNTTTAFDAELPAAAWDLTITHGDLNFPTRLWRTSIGAKDYPGGETAPNSLLLSIESSFRDAERLPLPEPSVPFLRYLTARLGNSVQILSGEAELCREATVLDSPEKIYRFMSILRDDTRRHPIVLASAYWKETGEAWFMATPEELAHSLHGLAHVFIEHAHPVLLGQSIGLASILEYDLGIPSEYLAWGGAVRVYRPGDALRFEPTDHRYMRRQDFPQKIDFLRGLRNGAYLLAQHDFALDRRGPIAAGVDLDRFALLERLEWLRRNAEISTNSESLVGLRTERDEWMAIAEDLDKANRKLHIELTDALTKNAETNKALSGTREALSAAYAENSELHAKIKALSAPSKSSQLSTEIGSENLTSGAAVLEAIQNRFSDRLAFTAKFERSLRNFEPNEPALFGAVYDAIKSMHENLWSGKFETNAPNFLLQFRDSSGFQLALTENKLTKEKPGLRALRQDTYNGEEFKAWAHLKHGNRPGEQFRLHFEFFEESKKIVLSWIGDHMPTSSSGKNGGRRG